VTISGQDNTPPAYGLVANISESGVCVAADVFYSSGRYVMIGLRFRSYPSMFETKARVVWSQPHTEETRADTIFLHGLQFTGLTAEKQQLLHRVLEFSRRPSGYQTIVDEDFQSLLNEISTDLDQLTSRLKKKIQSDE
jgi:Tfp pilus assembly protein PilZ